jgi:branched-chain amino acid transport system permease protein
VTRFVQSCVAGVGQGCVYSLLALGFAIVFKATGALNLAQPGFTILGAWFVVYFSTIVGLPFALAATLAVLLTALAALVVERVAVRPLVGESVFAIAILTIGVDVVIHIFVNDLIGSDVRPVGDPWGLRTVGLGGVVVQQRYLAMLATTAVVVGLLTIFFRRTALGLAMRATALDQEVAMAHGVSVGRVFACAWAVAGALAALAGLFIGAGSGIDQQSSLVALKAIPALVLGGFDSVPGAVAGGLAVGLAEGWSFTYQGQYAAFLGDNFSQVVPWLVMFVVLLVRPAGLFGTAEVKRV